MPCQVQQFLKRMRSSVQNNFFLILIKTLKIFFYDFRSHTTLNRCGFGVEYLIGRMVSGDGCISIPTMSPGLPGTQNSVLSITGILLCLSSVEDGVVFRFFHSVFCSLFKISTQEATPPNRMNNTTKGMR